MEVSRHQWSSPALDLHAKTLKWTVMFSTRLESPGRGKLPIWEKLALLLYIYFFYSPRG
jgi:hypothetical protein